MPLRAEPRHQGNCRPTTSTETEAAIAKRAVDDRRPYESGPPRGGRPREEIVCYTFSEVAIKDDAIQEEANALEMEAARNAIRRIVRQDRGMGDRYV
jgi:hypothetical protein